MVAGALETIEEWSTTEGSHPSLNDQAVPMHFFWEYVCWAVGTVLPVNLSDISLSTHTGQVGIIIIVLTIAPLLKSYVKELGTMVRQFFFSSSLPPVSQRPRYLILGCRHPSTLLRIVANLNHRENDVIAVVEPNLLDKFSLEVQDTHIISLEHTGDDMSSLYAPNTTLFIISDPLPSENRKQTDLRVVSWLCRVKASVCDIPRPRCVVQVVLPDTSRMVSSMNIMDENDRLSCREQTHTGGGEAL